MSLRTGDGADTAPYRLDVFSTDVCDVVRCAAGWLFDQAAGGWYVTVILVDAGDPRPLHILGLEVLDLSTAFTASDARPRAQLLAASTDLLESDRALRRYVLSGGGHRSTEVVLWGEEPGGLEDPRCAQYQLSTAALAFKQQALLAADVGQEAASATETFCCGMASRRIQPPSTAAR
ncbi:hypothetical protein [Mycobacterium terramassiliense]|uniref:hypothetical protein n=1 Tax=Mycobacterium terramassiliense TaxID=1841859 RepID=UPI00097D349F|nr:hypothetical protein [Mycobacterium terramassiliense]